MACLAEKPHVVTFEEEKHRYFLNGVRVRLSVTGVLTICGFQDFSNVPRETLDEKKRLGKNVHKVTQWLDTGVLVDWETVSSRSMPYITSYQRWFDKRQPRWEHREEPGVMIINGMLCGFMIDCRGWIDDEAWIGDLKTPDEASKSWEYQTAGYQIGAPWLPGQTEPYRRMALKLQKDGSMAKELVHTNDRHDQSVFRSALHISSIHVLEGRIKDDE